MLIRSSRGDTIIEVMISMTILGLILSFGYNAVSNSLKAGRTSQERSEAIKIAESQVELVKTRLDAGYRDVLTATNFCMPGNGNAPILTPSTIPAANIDTDDFISYPPGCVTEFFHIGIRRTSSPIAGVGATNHEYQITVRWDGLQGRRNESKLLYKLVDQ